jgi:hypothetical protein
MEGPAFPTHTPSLPRPPDRLPTNRVASCPPSSRPPYQRVVAEVCHEFTRDVSLCWRHRLGLLGRPSQASARLPCRSRPSKSNRTTVALHPAGAASSCSLAALEISPRDRPRKVAS